MRDIAAKSARTLPPASLPAVTRSPRGTLPDVTGPVLAADQIRAIRIGDVAIRALTADPEERQRLKDIRAQLGATTAAAAAPAAVPGAAPTPASVPVVDEPVAGLVLGPEQRALFGRVVGQLLGNTDAESRQVLTAIRTNHATYPGGVLQREFATLGEDLLPTLAAPVREQANALAGALQLAPDQIDAAIVERRNEVEARRQAASQAAADAADAANAAAARAANATGATAQATRAATMRAVTADGSAARAGGRPRTARSRTERAVADIRNQVSTGRARYDTQLRNRERAVSEAVRRQVSAYRLAQTRDELALDAELAQARRDQAQNAGGDASERAVGVQRRSAEVRRWADRAVAALQEGPQSGQARLVAEATTETTRLKRELDEAGGLAFRALGEWGERQSIASEDWWTTLHADLQQWSESASARADQWQTERGEAARLGLAQDLAAVQRLVELQRAGDRNAAREYMAGLDDEAKVVVGALLASSQGGPADLAGSLAAGIRERVRAGSQAGVESKLQDAVLALPTDAATMRHLQNLLAVAQPGWSSQDKAHQIHESVTRWRGFDEAAIFRALAGLTPLAAKVLRAEYQGMYDQSLEDALRGKGHVGWLNEDEMKTATALLEGGGGDSAIEGIVGSLNSAIAGLGTDTDEVKRILRSLADNQRNKVLEAYRKRYGESLDSALRGEWISTSQRDEALALSTGDIRGAEAIAVRRAVKEQYTAGDEGGGGGERYATIDRADAQAVFGQIRTEVEAEGTRRGWTSAQVEAEVALRNGEVEGAFDKRFAGEWWAQEGQRGPTALRTAFALSSGPGSDLLNAVADNDLARADVARLRLEDQGVYAEDAAINAVFRDQNSRSLAEVNRDLGPILRGSVEAKLAEQDRLNPVATEEERINRRMDLERQNARRIATLADERTQQRMDTLGSMYQLASGRTLSQMAEANMSGTAREEARARIAGRGVITHYQRIRFSIEGVGTDLPMLRSTLAGMSKAEIRKADEDWQRDHPGESLLEAIRGDTSGREEDDLVDLARNGAPQTVADVVAAARRRYQIDRRNDTFIGAWLTDKEVATARREVEGLESDLALLRRRDLTPDQRRSAAAHFDIAVDRANTAMEFQRNAVDAWGNILSTGAAIVAAIVVGLALAPFTAGGSGAVAVAVIASLVATGVSMATKALVKGGAYGTEEVWTDLAVGAVDAIVSGLTAGLGHALIGGVRVAAPASRAAMQALSKVGRAGATAGNPGRVASFLGRFGSQGALARAVESRAFLAGLAAETSPMYQRLAARGAAELIEQTVQAVPSQFATSLLDERVWRQPGGGPMLVLRNTLQGTAHSVAFGLGVGSAVHHVVMPGFQGIVGAFRPSVPEPHIPSGDVLSRMGSVRDRLGDFRAWQRENPGGTYREFYSEREARLVEASGAGDQARDRVREARRALLAELPPAERGNYADVPIIPASEGDFHRLVGTRGGDAHLVVRDGQAVIVLREGAPPSAVAALLPALRERVISRSAGTTLEGALPPQLREAVPIRRDPSLPTDTVRVVPIPREGGPIRGVEIVVGPAVRPVDIALHLGEVQRIRRWTGRVGEGRLVLASLAETLGVRMETPRDRARFEAAGELRKLGPIIDERIRRLAAAADNPSLAARIEAETLHLLAQQERARRILTGELVAEPRGFVASEGLPEGQVAQLPATSSQGAARGDVVLRARELLGEIRQLRQAEAPRLWRELAGHEIVVSNEAAKLYNRLVNERLATPEQLGGDRESFKQGFQGSAEEARALRETVLGALTRSNTPGDVAYVRERLAALDELRGRLEATHARLARVDADIDARRRAFDALPDRAQTIAAMNEGLTYDHVKRGPAGVCFPSGTLVATLRGGVAIEALRVGDTVLASDESTGSAGTGRVARRFRGWTDWVVELVLDGETLLVTRSHRIRVTGPDRWVPARLVVPGMRLAVSSEGAGGVVQRARVVQVESTTHNLEIEPQHTYLVGDSRVLVHNANPDEPPRDFSSRKLWEGEIYLVSIRRDGVWHTVYVGSTNKEGLTFARFQEHLRQGRPGAAGFRQDKAMWLDLVNRAGGVVEVGLDFRRYGDIKVEIKERGQFTDLGLAVLEEAYRRSFDQSQLHNRVEALSSKAFEKYYSPEHAPCR
jgi:hypothetical protein